MWHLPPDLQKSSSRSARTIPGRAWQENTGIWDSQTIQIMDLDTGDKTQVGGQSGSVTRILGFVGNDCIYGTGDSGDYLMSNGPCDGDLSEQHRYR